jgi:hypothetical protein
MMVLYSEGADGANFDIEELAKKSNHIIKWC